VTNLPPLPFTTTGQRARAGAVIAGALDRPSIDASALMETIDLLSAAVLSAAGVDEATARIALAALWEHPTRSSPAAEPRRRIQISDREREFVRDLGQRLRMVRGARRLHAARVAHFTGVPYDQLLDIERGAGIPTVLGLYRLGETLQVPLPLLMDDRKTPLDVLRILAGLQQTREDQCRAGSSS
jgi:hypothetical protein